MSRDRKPSEVPADQPLAYRVDDAGRMLGIGRSTVFKLIQSGKLEAKKLGAATVVTRESIERVFDEAEWCEATKRAKAEATA